jgi:hypothetical protein
LFIFDPIDESNGGGHRHRHIRHSGRSAHSECFCTLIDNRTAKVKGIIRLNDAFCQSLKINVGDGAKLLSPAKEDHRTSARRTPKHLTTDQGILPA